MVLSYSADQSAHNSETTLYNVISDYYTCNCSAEKSIILFYLPKNLTFKPFKLHSVFPSAELQSLPQCSMLMSDQENNVKLIYRRKQLLSLVYFTWKRSKITYNPRVSSASWVMMQYCHCDKFIP